MGLESSKMRRKKIGNNTILGEWNKLGFSEWRITPTKS